MALRSVTELCHGALEPALGYASIFYFIFFQ